jgi:hypothetical protein
MPNPIRSVLMLAAGLILAASAPLAAQSCTPAPVRALEIGSEQRGSFDERSCPAGVRQAAAIYSLEVTDEQPLEITMVTEGQRDVRSSTGSTIARRPITAAISVLQGEQTLMQDLGMGGTARLRHVFVPGSYRVLVMSDGEATRFTIAVRPTNRERLSRTFCTGADARLSITAGETRRGTTRTSDCRVNSGIFGQPLRQVYRMDVDRTTTVLVSAESRAYEAAVELRSADGRSLGDAVQDPTFGQQGRIRATLEPGTYHILVGGDAGGRDEGAYTLTTEVIPNDVLTVRDPVYAELRPSSRRNAAGGHYDEWRFLGRAGDQITFGLRAASFIPWVEIGHYHSDGEWHGFGTMDGTAPDTPLMGELRLQEGGEIVLRTGSLRAGGSGRYLVTLGGATGGIAGERRSVPRPAEALAAFSTARDAFQAERFAEAAAAFAESYEMMPEQNRSSTSFFWAFSVYRQAEQLARANTAGDAATARRAASLFREVIGILERHPGSHEQYEEVLGAARQFLANQEAVAAAGGG